ncbi:YbjN domain-containing protein [Rhodopseudomonas sp. RCAM05734]|uniref:YbjN domain-containing protein n=1 Tax=Rhodopseudomonas sp. RCAM05734 TaxID=3457549 RepID=UPI0040440625
MTAITESAITSVTAESLRDILQSAGYRVELVTDANSDIAILRSSTAGFAFDIRPGNRLAERKDQFVDFTFSAWLNIEGELPLDVVNRWNALRRFGRLQVVPGFLALVMDVSMIGGVMPNFIKAQLEIWDHLVQALVPYLRDELQKLGSAVPQATAETPADDAPAPEARVA